MAKLAASEAATYVAHQAIQVLGGTCCDVSYIDQAGKLGCGPPHFFTDFFICQGWAL